MDSVPVASRSRRRIWPAVVLPLLGFALVAALWRWSAAYRGTGTAWRMATGLPLATASVDAAMAILSAHHWANLERGLGEMKRVARKRAVLLTWVPDAPPFWLTEEYFPEIVAHDRTIFPGTAALTALLERRIGPVRMTPIPIPHDCTDGFLCAYWRRPECYLDAERRSTISSFALIDAMPGLAKLRADISSGRWVERHRHLLALDARDLGYRLVCCQPGASSI